ncbi:MAG: hypothetical protein HY711_03210 [Candidatus Melainabacteria bacterium]|nr:hypothetical protein [Candidatus Melainabacteria bacterium]
MLYESLAGRLPFTANSTVEMIDCHLYANPMPLKSASAHLSSCDALTALLNKALQKDPVARPSTMEQFGQQLQAAILSDSARLKSLRHLSQTMSNEPLQTPSTHDSTKSKTLQGLDSTKVSVLPANQSDNTKPKLPSTARTWLLAKLKRLWRELRDTHSKDTGGAKEFLLAQCPYCASAVNGNIKFCLECGHNLPSPQALVQLRLAQGIFSYPKSRKECHQVPEFSTKARIATSRPPSAKIKARLFLLVNLVILLLLCLSYLRAVNEKASSPLVKEGQQHSKR